MLSTPQRQVAAVPGCPIVAIEYNDGVVPQPELVQFRQQRSDIPIHRLHHGRIRAFGFVRDLRIDALQIGILRLQGSVDNVKGDIAEKRPTLVLPNKRQRVLRDQVIGVASVLRTVFAVMPPTHWPAPLNRSARKVIRSSSVIDPCLVKAMGVHAEPTRQLFVGYRFPCLLKRLSILGRVGILAIVPLAEDARPIAVRLECLGDRRLLKRQFTPNTRPGPDAKWVTSRQQHGPRR